MKPILRIFFGAVFLGLLYYLLRNIDFREIFAALYNKSAYFVMKNTSALTTREFEEIKIDTKSVEEAENSIIREHLGQIKLTNFGNEKEELLVKSLMDALSAEKQEGETNPDFERRITRHPRKILFGGSAADKGTVGKRSSGFA